MNYVSTRGHDGGDTFVDILLGGLMPDGGLAVPSSYPVFTDTELATMRGMGYRDLAVQVLSRYATDIPADTLRELIDRTYTAQVFCNGRPGERAEDITPVVDLEPGLSILALSNGPSLAFKDIALQLLGNLFEYALAADGLTLNILGATSGDTGSSAEYAMRGKRGISVFMLSPHGKMSAFQTAQMFSLLDPNIHNITVRGVFDDCQDIVKAVSNDLAFKTAQRIGTVNSINWARVAAQIVYYFAAYFAVTDRNDQPVSFSVPSGNFGNICAGHIARQMGLPIHRLILATNENDVLNEFIATGIYRPRTSAQTRQTSSPSMDISKASNLERFVFDLVDRDPDHLRALWADVDRTGSFDLSDRRHAIHERFGFVSGTSSHADRVATIRDTAMRAKRQIDPHTADGVFVGRQFREPGVRLVCLETALPAKFAETIEEALGTAPDRPAAFADIESRPQRFEVVDADVDVIKQIIVRDGLSAG